MKSFTVVALIGGVLLAGCDRPESPASSAPPAESVRLALNWVPEPEFGGIYAAQGNGAFARRGLAVDVFGGADTVLQMIATGKTEYGVLSADEIVIGRSRGIDVVGVFAVYQTSPQGLMVRASRGLSSLAEVFAQPGTVAMQPGLAYKDFLERTYGFAKVTVVPYDFTVQKFLIEEAYAQQCFVTSEPITARKAGVEPKVFLIAESGYNPYTAVIACSGQRAREQAAQVEAMRAALAEGWAAYLADPAPANAAMAKLNANMDLATFAEAAAAQKELIENPAGLGTMTAGRWEELVQQLLDLKVIEKPVTATECFVAAQGASG